MATITVVSPKTVYPGADSFFTQATEANSVSVAAMRWVYLDSSANWTPIASDGADLLGTNMVAGANITSGKTATDIFVYVPATIIEANSNATGTDPVIGIDYDIVVSSNDHQIDQADTSPGASMVVIRLSPKDVTGDTNVRVWVKGNPSILQFASGT